VGCAEHVRTEPGDHAKVAPRLVAVAELVRHDAEVVRQQQHERVAVGQPQLPTGLGRLQHPSRPGQVPGLAVVTSQEPRRLDHLRVLPAVRRCRDLPRVLEYRPGTGQVAPVTQRLRVRHDGEERGVRGHVRHAAWKRAYRATQGYVRVALP